MVAKGIEQIGFAGVNRIDLLGKQGIWNQILLDGIGVNQVIHLGQVAPDISAKLLKFLLF